VCPGQLAAQGGSSTPSLCGHHEPHQQSSGCCMAPVPTKVSFGMALCVATAMGGSPEGQMAACGHPVAQVANGAHCSCGHHTPRGQSGRCWLAPVVPKGSLWVTLRAPIPMWAPPWGHKGPGQAPARWPKPSAHATRKGYMPLLQDHGRAPPHEVKIGHAKQNFHATSSTAKNSP